MPLGTSRAATLLNDSATIDPDYDQNSSASTTACPSPTSSAHKNAKRKKDEENTKRATPKHLTSWRSLEKLKSLDLKQLLEQDLHSNAALQYYRQKGCLNESGRQSVVLTVVRELMKYNDCPTATEYVDVTTKICELFPHEDPEIYYCAPQDRHKNCTGKVPNKVRNIKYSLAKRKCGPIFKAASAEDVDDLSVSTTKRGGKEYLKPAILAGSTDKSDLALQSAIISLKHHGSGSWPNVLDNWSKLHTLRYQQLRNTRPLRTEGEGGSSDGNGHNQTESLVGRYFTEWPILTLPNGYSLLNQDFAELYPNRENRLLMKWEISKELIVELVSEEISKADIAAQMLLDTLREIPNDQQDASILCLLPSLCLKRGRGRGKAVSTNFSLAESQQSFILDVKIPGDLQREVNNLRTFQRSTGLRVQPLVVLVGPSLSKITASYVQIDNVRYLLRTPLAAVDACFKSFFALDAAYPKECEAVWLFIQRYFYEIHLEEDANITRVFTVISSLNGLSSKHIDQTTSNLES